MSATEHDTREPTRDEINRLEGPVILEFGASWCPHCRALAPRLARLLEDYPGVRHIKVEDGPGRPLGRSFRVKLWPNLVFLNDGQVVRQLARPDPDEVRDALARIAGPNPRSKSP
ncbi:MAG: thioredoxin family protein [Isosphaeraceae bacterium]